MANPQIKDKSLPATTTQQEDTMESATKAGQRRINIIWEFTQAFIAITITLSVAYCQINSVEAEELYYAFFLIVSMYFIRTNHTLVGGPGVKTLNQSR